MVIIEYLEPNEVQALSVGVRGPKQAGCLRMAFSVGRQASEAFQGVGGGEVCTRRVGDYECLVGIKRGLISFLLRNTDTRASR